MIDPTLRERIDTLAARYPRRQSVLLPALHLVQAHRGGFVTKEDLADVAELVGVPLSVAYGVKSYYTMYNPGPIGKYHLQIDTNIPAMLGGSGEILKTLEQELGIGAGETTPDGLFTLSIVEDLGSCGTVPVVQVNDRYYENLTPERTRELIAALRGGVVPDWPPHANWGTTCNVLLARRGNPEARTLAGYRASGGYQALEKALAMEPAAVQALVKEANVRGRGGAGFPMGVKWGFIPKDNKKPVYLVCNADEGEPGTFKDRQIMEHDPHLLVEGMAIAAHALGSELGFIYIRGEFRWIADILEAAIAEARSAGIIGPSMLGSGRSFDLIVHLGAGAYVCGEETALIESLEGKRGNPRMKPPFPAAEGLYGCPTIVNNVESLACVPFILEKGPAAFLAIGTKDAAGPKIFGVSGHVNEPGTYEVPMGTPLEDLLALAGGVKGKMKAVIVGGLSTPILTAAEAEGMTLDYEGCAAKGTSLGSGGVMVIAEGTSIPEVALRTIQFYAHESCGQCVPCRIGSHAAETLLGRILHGQGRAEDLDQVHRIVSVVRGTTLCPAGEAYCIPVRAMIEKFRPEFEALIAAPP